MKLQVAFDGTLDQIQDIFEEVYPFADIIEIGTSLIYRHGVETVRLIRKQAPQSVILADLKIMDAGSVNAQLAFEAGANMVTVLGVAPDATIRDVVEVAQKHNGQVVCDMIQVSNLIERSKQLTEYGCHYICLHTAFDLQRDSTGLHQELREIREVYPEIPVAIAGGITLYNLNQLLSHWPDIVIVGSSIVKATDPESAVRRFKEHLS